ncbi:MAG: hypothetical protein JSS56_20980 [Proteobacteria bacterium]|nr:hypothetical protein [Pseudomonadota bacterium]
MTGEVQLRWLDKPNVTPPRGWAQVLSPLGASILVPANSPGWELCTDWLLLNSGRGALQPTDPVDYFGEVALATMPVGLVAELYASSSRTEDFVRLLVQDGAARAHILRIAQHVFGAEPEEWALIDRCEDTARVLEARAMARAAAAEAV